MQEVISLVFCASAAIFYGVYGFVLVRITKRDIKQADAPSCVDLHKHECKRAIGTLMILTGIVLATATAYGAYLLICKSA